MISIDSLILKELNPIDEKKKISLDEAAHIKFEIPKIRIYFNSKNSLCKKYKIDIH
jgi:hypothetical protein